MASVRIAPEPVPAKQWCPRRGRVRSRFLARRALDQEVASRLDIVRTPRTSYHVIQSPPPLPLPAILGPKHVEVRTSQTIPCASLCRHDDNHFVSPTPPSPLVAHFHRDRHASSLVAESYNAGVLASWLGWAGPNRTRVLSAGTSRTRSTAGLQGFSLEALSETGFSMAALGGHSKSNRLVCLATVYASPAWVVQAPMPGPPAEALRFSAENR